MFNLYPIDNEVKSSLTKTIEKLFTSKLTKEDKVFVNNLNNFNTKDQFRLIYNIVSIGYSAVQTFIDKEETVSVPYLGMFKYIEGKKINKEVTREVLTSKGFTSFKSILDDNTKTELTSEIKTIVKDRIKTSIVSNPNRGKGNAVLPFTLKLAK